MRKLALLLSIITLSLAVTTTTAGALTITPVASGLDNPRGLAFGPNGALYVAEAGVGEPTSASITLDSVMPAPA